MKNILYILAAVALISFSSCDGFLDKDPDTGVPVEMAMTSYAEADQIVNGIYSAWISASLYSTYITLLPELQSDLFYAVNGFSNTYGTYWRWDFQPSQTEIQGVYYALYVVIMRCNFFIDNYDAVMQVTTDKNEIAYMERFLGEVYTSRALAYSELIKLFCEAYDPAKASQQYGVSITDSYEIKEKYVQRSSLKDSYAFVLKDLEMAAEQFDKGKIFSAPVPNAVYFNKAAVDALRARICLYMRDWDGAVEYASAVIDNKSYSFDLCNAITSADYYNMWYYDQGAEVIFRIYMTTTNYGGSLSWPFHHYDLTHITPDFVPAAWVLNLYDQMYDGRYLAFFSSVTTDHQHALTWPLFVKNYTNPDIDGGGVPRFVNMPKLFRLSELYLIRAEANYMLGEETLSNNDLTTLRKKRVLGYGSSNYTGSTLFTQIKNERVKELIGEGFRLQDLKRWNEGFVRRPQSESLSPADALVVGAGDKRFVWPIPQHEVDSNPGVHLNQSNY